MHWPACSCYKLATLFSLCLVGCLVSLTANLINLLHDTLSILSTHLSLSQTFNTYIISHLQPSKHPSEHPSEHQPSLHLYRKHVEIPKKPKSNHHDHPRHLHLPARASTTTTLLRISQEQGWLLPLDPNPPPEPTTWQLPTKTQHPDSPLLSPPHLRLCIPVGHGRASHPPGGLPCWRSKGISVSTTVRDGTTIPRHYDGDRLAVVV